MITVTLSDLYTGMLVLYSSPTITDALSLRNNLDRCDFPFKRSPSASVF
jgi:hypothetical protein